MKKLLPVFIIMLLLTSCGSDIVARVGGIKITTDEFAFYLDSIKTQMQGTELKTDEDWETQEIEGKKAIDVAKEKAMESAINNALYIEVSKAAGIKLTSEDIAENTRIKSQFVEGYGGARAYKDYLKENNITDRFMSDMVESSCYLTKITDMVNEEEPVTEEEIYSYYENNKTDIESRYRKAKHILIMTVEENTGFPLSKPENDAALRVARNALDEVRAGGNFDELMNTLSEDPGLAENPDGYVYTIGEMQPEFEECVDSLDYESYAICETEFGYHVVKRLPVSYEDIKEKLMIEVLGSKVEEAVNSLADEHGVKVEIFEENYKDIK